MCTRSRITQYLLNKLKFFTNKKKFFANYFLILRPGLLNKISIFFIFGLIKFLKFWVPNRPKNEILFSKLGLRNKKCFVENFFLFMKNWNLFSKNWVFRERVHIWIQFLRQNVHTGVQFSKMYDMFAYNAFRYFRSVRAVCIFRVFEIFSCSLKAFKFQSKTC